MIFDFVSVKDEVSLFIVTLPVDPPGHFPCPAGRGGQGWPKALPARVGDADQRRDGYARRDAYLLGDGATAIFS
jgi:hypothetical protein